MVSIQLLIAATTLTVAINCLPAEKEPVPILSQVNDQDVDGKYHYSFESGDGTKAEQSGELKQIDKDLSVEISRGSFEYTGDDGKSYHLNYIADESGYQPQGEHLPVAPETPPLIARALAFLATAPPPKEE